MKKVIGLVILLFVLVGCNDNVINMSNKNNIVIKDETIKVEMEIMDVFTDETLNYYDIKATLDVEKDLIHATQMVTYTNVEDKDLEMLYFHLYPNAFTEESHPSLFDTNVDEIQKQYGYVEIESLKINGETVNYENKPIETILAIDYNFIMGKTYDIELIYTVGVSTTSERFGIVNGIYNLGNWYPVLAVYDEDGWNLDPYYSIGDPFYSDVSNYDVEITVPEGYEVAASGYQVAVEENQLVTYQFRADRMRDFAFVIGDNFVIDSTVINDTTVYLYYPEHMIGHKWIDEALTFGAETIELFNEKIGPYPYKNYSVVITNFPSGMEYPGLVFISDGYFDGYDITNMRNVIVHETIHQWFYSLIGDDEIDEGWIDEGLTSYFTAYFDLKLYKEYDYNRTMDYYKKRVDAVGLDNIEVLKSASEFADWGEYGLAAYVTPALMYQDIYDTYGEAKLLEFAQLLYDRHVFGVLKEDTLKLALINVYGEEIMKIFDYWLN